MVYDDCPLSLVVTSHHFLPSCTQIGVVINDMMSFPTKIAFTAINSTLVKYLRAYEQLSHGWMEGWDGKGCGEMGWNGWMDGCPTI